MQLIIINMLQFNTYTLCYFVYLQHLILFPCKLLCAKLVKAVFARYFIPTTISCMQFAEHVIPKTRYNKLPFGKVTHYISIAKNNNKKSILSFKEK